MTASADSSTPGRPRPETGSQYNRLFERLVGEDEDDLAGLIAYSLYKQSKREWAAELWESQRRKPTEAELDAYVATWTPTRLQSLRSEAETALLQHGSAFIDAARAGIREEAVRDEVRGLHGELTGAFAKTQGWGVFGWAVVAGVLSALVYTILLIIAAYIIKRNGIDLVSLLR